MRVVSQRRCTTQAPQCLLILSILTAFLFHPCYADNIVSIPVGFVRIEVPPNDRVLASIPFYPFDDAVDSVLAGQLPCSTNLSGAYRIIKWDADEQVYIGATKTSVEWDPDAEGPPVIERWFADPDLGIPSEMTLYPGEGFWIENRSRETQNVFLCGQVVLDETVSLQFLPGLNLFSYPYSESREILDGDELLQETDQVSKYGEEGYSFAESDEEDGVQWVSPSGAGEAAILEMGRGYGYQRNNGEALAWVEDLPYYDAFPTGGPPCIVGMAAEECGSEITLTIACTGQEGERLDILYQDVLSTGPFASGSGWKLADAGIRTYFPDEVIDGLPDEEPVRDDEPHASSPEEESERVPPAIRWTDSGYGVADRDEVNQVSVRYYLIGRSDIDNDEDGLPDAREIFIHRTDPASTDSDRDGMPDGWELANGLNPLRDDGREDPDADGKTSFEEFQAGTRPQYAREHNVTIYVDRKTGNDTYAGLVDHVSAEDGPKRTINAALEDAIPGDTIIVNEGAYNESVDMRGRGIRFRIRGRVEL